jgi:hypothetical protein
MNTPEYFLGFFSNLLSVFNMVYDIVLCTEYEITNNRLTVTVIAPKGCQKVDKRGRHVRVRSSESVWIFERFDGIRFSTN